MELFLDTFSAPLGEILLVHDQAGTLRALDFTDYKSRMRRLLRLHYGRTTLSPRAAPATTTDRLHAYFAGDVAALNDIPIATGGTAFQRAVWAALRGIPSGRTTSYGALAGQIGQPAAVRAVGAANSANPIGIIVPCHRVIGTSGKLTGYAGGLARKAWLLAHEGARDFAPHGAADARPNRSVSRLGRGAHQVKLSQSSAGLWAVQDDELGALFKVRQHAVHLFQGPIMSHLRKRDILRLAAVLTLSGSVSAYAGTFKVLHAFQGGSDGTNPAAPLNWVGGRLYSTTLYGGTGGYGTAYILSGKGKEKTLYPFTDSADGGDPFSTLTELNGVFYGTTSSGGAHSQGTIFSLTPDGKETVLYSFNGPADGRFPLSGLVAMNGVLYGVTAAGGDSSCNGGSGCGVVYSFTPGGTFSTVYRLSNASGWYASANLLPVNGTLYGTAQSGGANGEGTVFAVTPKGKFNVLYSFSGGADGGAPVASLTQIKGVFYGTTQSGGAYSAGVAFSLSSGKEKVLHSFGSGSDGAQPESTLIALNGKFYGTTNSGGAFGGGTIFSISANGKEVVERSLNGADGIFPNAGLIAHKGVLYGNTYVGGDDNCNSHGCGTVFSYTPDDTNKQKD